MRRIKITTMAVLLGLTLCSSAGAFYMSQSSSCSYCGSYMYPNPSTVTKPNYHGLTPGTLDTDKKVVGSSHVEIIGLTGDTYGVIPTTVSVDRRDKQGNVVQTLTGKATHYSDLNANADNGYVFVDKLEAETWIKVFNGNPDHVFKHVKKYTIQSIEGSSSYEAYNLAEIAILCEGAGGKSEFKPKTTSASISRFSASAREEKEIQQIQQALKVREQLQEKQAVVVAYLNDANAYLPMIYEDGYLYMIEESTLKKSDVLFKVLKVHSKKDNEESIKIHYKDGTREYRRAYTVKEIEDTDGKIQEGKEVILPIVHEFKK